MLHVGLLNGPHTNSYALFCQLENRTDLTFFGEEELLYLGVIIWPHEENAPTLWCPKPNMRSLSKGIMQSLLQYDLANRNDFHGPLKDTRIARTGGEIDAFNLANGNGIPVRVR